MTKMLVKVRDGLMTKNEIVVRDGFRSFTFPGKEIVDLSWDVATVRAKGRYRWTDMILYRMLGDGPYEYILQVIGRTVVYHRPGSPCGRGARMSVSNLYASDPDRYDILEPCPERGCKPKDLEHLDNTDIVSVEEDRYTLDKCKTLNDLIDALRDEDGKVSGLGDKLLTTAKMADKGIRDAMSTPEPL